MLTVKTGVKNLLIELNKMHLNESSQAYEAHDIFEKFVRPSDMSTLDYVLKFWKLYFKTNSFQMEISDYALAYRLINIANLSIDQKQLKQPLINGLSDHERSTKESLYKYSEGFCY